MTPLHLPPEPKPDEILIEQSNSLKEYLDMMEKLLIQRCLAAIPRDLDLLEQLVIEHKQFENDLTSRELEVWLNTVISI